MRSRTRTSGRFSSREMVGCEQSAAPSGSPSSASLKTGSCRRLSASLPSSYPAAIISMRKRRMVARPCRTRSGARGSSMQAEPIGDAEPTLDLAQGQQATV